MSVLAFPIALILFITLLFVQPSIALTSGTPLEQQQLFPTYSSPKSILFACTIGGSSHANWVLAILNDLKHRGHQITFATKVN